MKLKQIEVFHTAFTAGSVSKAAKILGVSQPAVSKTLRHTEDQLGFALFHRTANGLTPTSQAVELYENSARVFNELEQLRRRSVNIGFKQDKVLRIAFAPSIGLSIAPDVTTRFLKTSRKTNVKIETLHFAQACEALQANEIDIAILYEPLARSGLRAQKLANIDLVCVVPKGHALTKKPLISLQDLKGEQIIGLDEEAPLGQLLHASVYRDVEDVKTQVTANTYHLAKMMVGHGGGVAIIDALAATTPPTDDVEIIPFREPISISISALLRDNYELANNEKALLKLITGKVRSE